jgi:hypothetical protein
MARLRAAAALRTTAKSLHEYFRTGHGHWPPSLATITGHRYLRARRKRAKAPSFFVNAVEAKCLDLKDGDWARIASSTASIVNASIPVRACRKDSSAPSDFMSVA